MNKFECLEDQACENGVDVIRYKFENGNIKGLCCDGVIGLNDSISTNAERACVLSEELGHYHTTVGNIIDMSTAQNRKQERQARLWAYNNQIGLNGLIRAYEHGCTNRYEVAEYLEVTEKFMQEAIDCYREKYGVYTLVDNYTIYFIPQLAVCKRM